MNERNLREFIAYGSGRVDSRYCMPYLTGPKPATDLYITVMLVRDWQTTGTPGHVARAAMDSEGAEFVEGANREHLRALYSVQWFGAYAGVADQAAKRFRTFAVSQMGILAAENGYSVWDRPDGEPDWRPFTVVTPFPAIRQVDAMLPSWQPVGGALGDDLEERRGIDLEVEYLEDSTEDLGGVDRFRVIKRDDMGETVLDRTFELPDD